MTESQWRRVSLVKFGPPVEFIGAVDVFAPTQDAAVEFLRINDIGSLDKARKYPGRVRVSEAA